MTAAELFAMIRVRVPTARTDQEIARELNEHLDAIATEIGVTRSGPLTTQPGVADYAEPADAIRTVQLRLVRSDGSEAAALPFRWPEEAAAWAASVWDDALLLAASDAEGHAAFWTFTDDEPPRVRLVPTPQAVETYTRRYVVRPTRLPTAPGTDYATVTPDFPARFHLYLVEKGAAIVAGLEQDLQLANGRERQAQELLRLILLDRPPIRLPRRRLWRP